MSTVPIAYVPVPAHHLPALYALLAQLVGDGDPSEASPPESAGVADSNGAQTEREPFRISAYRLHDPDFARLVEYYRRLSGLGRQIHDLLADHPGQRFTAVELAERLDVDSTRAIAGSLGHAGRFALEQERDFPISWDRDTNTFTMRKDLAEAVRYARCWALPRPYQHRIEAGSMGLMLEEEHDEPHVFLVQNDVDGFVLCRDPSDLRQMLTDGGNIPAQEFKAALQESETSVWRLRPNQERTTLHVDIEEVDHVTFDELAGIVRHGRA